MYYKYWFSITLLTFPGAALGWLVKKDTFGYYSFCDAGITCFAWNGLFQRSAKKFSKSSYFNDILFWAGAAAYLRNLQSFIYKTYSLRYFYCCGDSLYYYGSGKTGV